MSMIEEYIIYGIPRITNKENKLMNLYYGMIKDKIKHKNEDVYLVLNYINSNINIIKPQHIVSIGDGAIRHEYEGYDDEYGRSYNTINLLINSIIEQNININDLNIFQNSDDGRIYFAEDKDSEVSNKDILEIIIDMNKT